MAHYGSLEGLEKINSRIHPMESTGLRRVLEVSFLQLTVSQWHGMERNGSLEAQEQIDSRIHPME
jgi:hypothetical protein